MIYTLTLNPAVDRELTVPAVEYDTVLRAVSSRTDLGGKGFNVSRLLAKLGTPSVAAGFLAGKAGELLQSGLRELGIGVDFVWVAGETRTNVSIVTPAGGHYIKVNETGPTIEPERQAGLLARIESLAKAGDWWVLGGSLPPGVPADFYSRIIAALKARGALALLDTSGEPLAAGCRAGPDLVKPNAAEAQALTGLPVGTPAEAAVAAARIRELGPLSVIISLGRDGALLHTSEGTWLARSPRVVEKNPIGAGDSMVGGLVWALTRGLPLPQALRWGVASGAATASLSGTELGAPELIEALLAQVVVEVLEPARAS